MSWPLCVTLCALFLCVTIIICTVIENNDDSKCNGRCDGEE